VDGHYRFRWLDSFWGRRWRLRPGHDFVLDVEAPAVGRTQREKRGAREIEPFAEGAAIAHLDGHGLAVERIRHPQPRAEGVLVVRGRGRVVHVEDLAVRHAVALEAGAIPAGVALVG